MPIVTTSLGYSFAFRSFGMFPNPLSTLQKIRMIINSVVMSHLQYGFSTYIVRFSHDDFNLHHWLVEQSKRIHSSPVHPTPAAAPMMAGQAFARMILQPPHQACCWSKTAETAVRKDGFRHYMKQPTRIGCHDLDSVSSTCSPLCQ